MLSTRWLKLWRDLQMTPWRSALMLLTTAAGVLGFTIMLSSYTLLTREMSRNYLATNPASASLEVDNIDAALLAQVRAFPGIAQAQASATLTASYSSADGSLQPLKIFVLEDFNQLHINTIFSDAGAWPPLPNSLLLERDSLTKMQVKIGDNLAIHWSDDRVSSLRISGKVQDPSMPVPSIVAFAYASPSTLAALGVNTPLTELKITVSEHAFDSKAIEHTASQLALNLQQQGHRVARIRIPPPGEHPHQRIIFAVLGAFLIFSVIALTLCAILTATIIDGLIAQQVRQIGVMKSIGASAVQIASLYLTFVLILSILATVLGVPPGLSIGLALSKIMLANLNFSLQSAALPAAIYWVLIATGVLLPLLLAAVPIIKATRLSAQQALTYQGTKRQYFKSGSLGKWLYRLAVVDPSLIMALRNSFRRRGRALLVLALLASAGAMFMSGLNLKSAAQHHLIAAAAERHYDLEISLSQAEDSQKISALIQAVEGVKQVETWASSTLARHNSEGQNIETTYADGGHGTLYVTAIPPGSQLLSLNLRQGHWLNTEEEDGENAVVLNRKGLESFPHAKLGDQLTLGVAGHALTVRLVGIVEQKMTGGMAYVTVATYQQMTGQDERYKNYRIVMQQHDEISVDAATKKIETALTQHHIKIQYALTESRVRHEVDVHFTLLLNALLFMSMLIGVVGLFALGSVLSTQIAERTREFGIMRSIGASSGIIMRNLFIESLFIGALSWCIAVALSLPLSTVISALLGNFILDEAFPLAISLTSLWVWFFMVLTGAILASAYPAWKAAHITIYDSFAY